MNYDGKDEGVKMMLFILSWLSYWRRYADLKIKVVYFFDNSLSLR